MKEREACNGQGSRAKILDAAKELFYEVGYQTTSVDDILRKCCVSKSNFYYHFKTKEDLGFAVLQERFNEHETTVIYPFHDPQLAPTERLRRFFHNICELHTRLPGTAGCPFGNFAAALAASSGRESDERFRRELSAFFLRLQEMMRDCIAEGVALGEFRNDIAPSEAAEMALANIQGYFILTKTHQNPALLERGLQLTLRLLLPLNTRNLTGERASI